LKVWAIANQKGGVGKTTTVVNLAGVALKEGKRVLVVDTDPHSSLGYYLGMDSDKAESTLYDIFKAYDALSADLVLKSIVHMPLLGLDILPANIGLSMVDRAMGQHVGMGLVLRQTLKFVQGRYDLVIIDCPPILGVLMVNALAACELIIMPVQTDFLSLRGLERMVKTLTLMGQAQSIEYRYLIVPTMFDRRNQISFTALEYLQNEFKKNLWDRVIPIDNSFRNASLSHLPLTHLSSSARGTRAYNLLFSECMTKEGGHVDRR
jgi:chromosome partitioning protein